MNIFQFILDTILPPDPLVRAIEGMDAAAFAERAGALSAEGMAPGIVSFFPYRNETVKAALIEMKERRNRKIAALLGAVARERLAPLAQGRPLLVPVPMTRKRLRERGWNQCAVLVEAIGKEDAGGIFEICTDALRKIRENEDQVGKGRAARFENLSGCFAVKDMERVRGRDVIVLDDIATTGATLAEAKRALSAAGARSVILASIAH